MTNNPTPTETSAKINITSIRHQMTNSNVFDGASLQHPELYIGNRHIPQHFSVPSVDNPAVGGVRGLDTVPTYHDRMKTHPRDPGALNFVIAESECKRAEITELRSALTARGIDCSNVEKSEARLADNPKVSSTSTTTASTLRSVILAENAAMTEEIAELRALVV
jgi:hypothetical protein